MSRSKFGDKRSGRIVFVCYCFLNQNAKFPGIVSKWPGAINEILQPIMDSGVGIEQLPCLERLGWGGVSRSYVNAWSGNIEEEWVQSYSRLCKSEAEKSVNSIEEYIRSGYEVLGILARDGSPTCGFNKASKFPDYLTDRMKQFKGKKLDEINLEEYERAWQTTPSRPQAGSGVFIGHVAEEIRRRGLNIPIVGFEERGDLQEQKQNILEKLKIDLS